MKKWYYFLVSFSVFSQLLFSQQKKEITFGEIRKNYEKMTIDDVHAMPYVKLYIRKAKAINNFEELIQGYRDGRQFDYENKVPYADSAIAVSLKHGSNDDISKDYLSKGIIYYFYQKKFKEALNYYLKAYEYAKNSRDDYHLFKVVYHIGVVKEHLGYHEEALEHFQKCIDFYSIKLNQELHDNERFNYKKAYLNSLHQMTVINRHLKNFAKSDSLSQLGYTQTLNDHDFLLENGYFLKCIGISKFHKKNYDEARKDLEKALPIILKRNDYAWASVIYYYLGKISEHQSDTESAIHYYKEIDSIFDQHAVILPEVYKSYDYLIKYYQSNDVDQQLYYTNQLLKADSLISKDYPYLSSKLHKDYDRRALMEQRDEIEKSSKRKIFLAKLLILIGSICIIFFIVRYIKDQKIKKHYHLLQQRISDGTYTMKDHINSPTKPLQRKTSISEEIIIEISEELKIFEQEKQFLKKGLTEVSVALKLATNSHYLSVYINEHKGMNFNRYIAELRINYITYLLNSNTKYLHYTVEALANECGIATRQNFSDLFFKINGLRPTDFIRKRLEEIDHSPDEVD